MTYGTPAYASYNANVDAVAASVLWAYVLDTTSANSHLLNTEHWDYTGQNLNADGFKAISLDSSKIGAGATYAANKALYDGSAARSGAVWDSTAKGTNISIIGQKDVAQALTGSFTSVRATVGKASGKYYYRLLLGAPPSNQVFWGVSDASTAGGAGLDVYNPTNSAMIRDDGFASAVGFTKAQSGAPGSFATGDYLDCAVDATAKKMWLGKNGTWLSSGDPAAGTNPYFTWSSNYTVFPTIALYGAYGFIKLLTSGAGGTPPSGFTWWDG
jgi:hypothetical protein